MRIHLACNDHRFVFAVKLKIYYFVNSTSLRVQLAENKTAHSTVTLTFLCIEFDT